MDIEEIIEVAIMKKGGVGLEKDSFLIMSEVVGDLDQVKELVLIEDRIKCYKCREYDNFAKSLSDLKNREVKRTSTMDA